MKPTGKILLYGLYTIVAVCFFLYLLFPSQTVGELIVARIQQASPDVQVSMKAAYPTFPPGLKMEPLAFGYADTPIVSMAHMKVVPTLFSMLGNQKEFAFNGPLGPGGLKGYAEFTMDSQRPQTRVNLNLSDVPIDVFEVLQQWPEYKLSGDLSAYIDYDSRKGTGGTTNVKMTVTPTKIMFTPPVIGLEQMEFTRLEAELVVTPRMLQIKSCDVSGSQIEGKITGSIIFRQPLANSRLILSCTLKPQPAFLAEHKNDMLAGFLGSEAAQKRGVIFRIAGTLGNPSYVLR